MIEKEKCIEITKKIKNLVKDSEFEVLISTDEESLTRYANSLIHQNVKSSNTNIQLRLVDGKKIGIASTNIINDEGLSNLVKKASEIKNLSEPDTEFHSLPEPKSINYPDFEYFDNSDQFDSEDYKADVVGNICERAKKSNHKAFGKFSTDKRELFIGNTNGIESYLKSTYASLKVQIMSDFDSGYAQVNSKYINQLNTEETFNEAYETCIRNNNPIAIEPKEYEVILKPEAVNDVLQMLSHMGFSCNSINEGNSFLSNKLGEKIFDEKLNITDDGLNKEGVIMPFDFEGFPKERIEIIKNGIFTDFATDSKWSIKLNRRNTGHALPAPNTYGPLPINLIISPGTSTLDEMISKSEEAILITHFWYSNPLHPKKGLVTGLTRDGTFLVKNGKIVNALKNLRYTDSFISLLSNIISLGNNLKLCDENLVPAMRCKSLRFTSIAPS